MPPQATKIEGKRSDATRRALTHAARDEFAEHGLAGARVDRIADAAGVNKERIYGLFGSKDKLFDAVLIDAMREFIEVVDPLSIWPDSGRFVAGLYDYHREHPQLLRLMVWEALERGTDVADIDGWRRRHYDDKLERAQVAFGTDKFSAGLVTLALCGIANWVNLAPQARRLLLGDRADDAEAIRDFMAAFAKGAFAAFDSGFVPVNDLTDEADDPVERAAARLRRAQTEAESARAELAEALRRANAEGVSANALARRVSGTLSRPVVLKLLAD
ncbi:TetR/AcrR family transcriptional regulator [Glycomyces tarimensis]